MPQWLLSTSMLSEVAVVSSMQPCQAQMPSVRLNPPWSAPAAYPPAIRRNERPLGRRGGRSPFQRPPGRWSPSAGRDWLPSVHHRAHPIRHHLGKLACVEAAEAPADELTFAAHGCRSIIDEIDHRCCTPGADRDCGLAPSR